jgi:hypothetical protein
MLPRLSTLTLRLRAQMGTRARQGARGPVRTRSQLCKLCVACCPSRCYIATARPRGARTAALSRSRSCLFLSVARALPPPSPSPPPHAHLIALAVSRIKVRLRLTGSCTKSTITIASAVVQANLQRATKTGGGRRRSHASAHFCCCEFPPSIKKTSLALVPSYLTLCRCVGAWPYSRTPGRGL